MVVGGYDWTYPDFGRDYGNFGYDYGEFAYDYQPQPSYTLPEAATGK